jgi:hypothetical protein
MGLRMLFSRYLLQTGEEIIGFVVMDDEPELGRHQDTEKSDRNRTGPCFSPIISIILFIWGCPFLCELFRFNFEPGFKVYNLWMILIEKS